MSTQTNGLSKNHVRQKINWLSFLGGCIIILLSSCNKDEPDPPENEPNFPFEMGDVQATFLENQSYNSKARTKFDIFIPESETPTGLVIYMHGGGFQSGDKSFVYEVQRDGDWDFPEDIKEILTEKIAFASINYTFMTEASPGGLKCFLDASYAVQYFKHNKDEFNIDPDRIVLAGNSAGGGMALWVATIEDLSRPNSEDIIKHQSTRVRGAVSRRSQCSYDLKRWVDDVFIDYEISMDQLLADEDFATAMELLYELDSIDEIFSLQATQQRAVLDILRHISADDPELFVSNRYGGDQEPVSYSQYNHHVFHVRELIEACENVGLPYVGYYGDDPVLYSDPSNEDWVDYCIRKINEE